MVLSPMLISSATIVRQQVCEVLTETLLEGGSVLCADVTDAATIEFVRRKLGGHKAQLIGADPPYGNIVDEGWDDVESIVGHQPSEEAYEKAFVDWMITWTLAWSDLLDDGGAMNIWGGVGVISFRPFYRFLNKIERASGGVLSLANHITWKKKRAYGISHNYLFTREELAYLVKGNPKKPRCFNIPLLDTKRGYAGFNLKYPAKSEYLRRSNVWDEPELFRGKRHRCHKPPRVNEIQIEVSTHPGECVIDLFSGSGSLSKAAQALGRTWIAVEQGESEQASIVEWLSESVKKGRAKTSKEVFELADYEEDVAVLAATSTSEQTSVSPEQGQQSRPGLCVVQKAPALRSFWP